MLDLDFTDEQEMLRQMVRGVCAQHSPVEVVRALEDDPVGYPPALWDQLAELGLLGLVVPEEHGGSGMSTLDGVVVYEELGRAVAPTPHLVSSVLSARALRAGGSEAQQGEWLPRIAAGEAIVTPAWLEPDNGFGPLGVQVRAEPAGDGTLRVSGVKQHVYFATSAQRLLLLARTGDAPDAVDLFLVDPHAPGVTLDQRRSISSDTQYRVDLDGVQLTAADRLGDPGTGWAAWQDALVDGMILTAAAANGGCEHALDITVQYAKDREQFGKPLGAFQAISHYLADARTVLDGSKVLTYEAAWARDRGDATAPKLAAMAKLFAGDAFRDTTAMAQQVFGGVGFTVEYEIQLYFRRAKQLQLSWNDSRRCEDLIAEAVLDVA